MLKKIIIGLLMTSSLFSQVSDNNFFVNFFKYSTAYASFSLNAPRYQDDRFAITGGLSTGVLEVERTERELKPDFQTSFGLRKIGRFQYEPKRGVKSAGKGGTWYDGSEHNANESATFGPVKGWEYLIKWSEGRQWGNDYVNQEYWVRYIGDWVMAIGNPFGFGHSVSQGIISGVGRFGLQLSTYEGYIQTDATIHLGSSGGALIDAQGRLVGINTLIYTAGGEGAGEATGIGINLATPSELAATALSDIVNYGHVIRGWLGVSVEVLLSEDASGRPLQRLIVTDLASDGPAERAGIALNDIIVAMDGALVVDGRAAMMQIARLRPGHLLRVQVDRDGQVVEIEAVVGTRANNG